MSLLIPIETNKRLGIMLHRTEKLNKALEKANQLNKELIKKVVQKEMALVKVQNENNKLMKKTLDLMCTLSLKTSENNELKQIIQAMDSDVNKVITSVGDISFLLLNTKKNLSEMLDHFDKSGTKKCPEMSSPSNINHLTCNPEEVEARKKYARKFKINHKIALSPITEFVTPQISQCRKGQNKSLFDFGVQNDNENNQLPNNNFSINLSNDSIFKKNRTSSLKACSSEKFGRLSVSRKNIVRELKLSAEQSRRGKSKVGFTEECKIKEQGNISYSSVSKKEQKDGDDRRRSQRIKMKQLKYD